MLAFPGCAAAKGMMVHASAQHIRGCNPSELAVSNTYGSNPVTGPSWKAVRRQETYECTGYPQIAATVRCHRLN